MLEKSKTGQRNLIELISRFPSKGVGMQVYRKGWPEDCYWKIWEVQKGKQGQHRIYGVKYWNGELQSVKIDKVRGQAKRGIWQFDVSSLEDEHVRKYAADLEKGRVKEEDYLKSPHEIKSAKEAKKATAETTEEAEEKE